MADDKSKKGGADRKRVAAGQTHEVKFAAKSMGTTTGQVKAAAKSAGPMRQNVRRAATRGK